LVFSFVFSSIDSFKGELAYLVDLLPSKPLESDPSQILGTSVLKPVIPLITSSNLIIVARPNNSIRDYSHTFPYMFTLNRYHFSRVSHKILAFDSNILTFVFYHSIFKILVL
jgi:hypothetical protein